MVWFLMSLKCLSTSICHSVLFASVSLPFFLWCHNPTQSPTTGASAGLFGVFCFFFVTNRKNPNTLEKPSCGIPPCFICLFHFRSKLKIMYISVFAFTLMLLSPGNELRNACWVHTWSTIFINRIKIQIKRSRIYFWSKTSHEFTNRDYWKMVAFLRYICDAIDKFSLKLWKFLILFLGQHSESIVFKSPSGVKTPVPLNPLHVQITFNHKMSCKLFGEFVWFGFIWFC